MQVLQVLHLKKTLRSGFVLLDAGMQRQAQLLQAYR
jgi:hypothetical protein